MKGDAACLVTQSHLPQFRHEVVQLMLRCRRVGLSIYLRVLRQELAARLHRAGVQRLCGKRGIDITVMICCLTANSPTRYPPIPDIKAGQQTIAVLRLTLFLPSVELFLQQGLDLHALSC